MQQINNFFQEFSIEDYFLQTERLILKCLDSSFAADVASYYYRNKDRFSLAVFDNTYYLREKSLFEEILWNEFELTVRDKFRRLFIFHKDDFKYEHIIGDVIIYNIELSPRYKCEIGYKIDKGYTGNKFAEEAALKTMELIFERLPVGKIELTIHPDNRTSIILAERMGYSYEGITKSYVKIEDKFHDFLRYYLLRSEWEKNNKG